jgi:hypothetical protein
MNHTKSKVTIYQTDDYSLFRLLEGNRPLNKKKIEKIISEISSGNDILDEVPILVNENKNHLEVLDGQHRLEVAKKLKRAVHYTIKKSKMSLYNVAKVNSNTEKWTSDDFINCYSKAGNENYIKIGAFYKKYKIGVGSILSLFTYGIQNHDGTIAELFVQFEQGTFEIKKYKDAVQFAELCKSFSEYPNWNTRAFLIAISKIIRAEKCQIDVLLKKFKDDPKQLTYHPDWKGVITNLEEIYNKGNSKRRVIY